MIWALTIPHGSEVEFSGNGVTVRHPKVPTFRVAAKGAARFVLHPICTLGQRLELWT